jgi:CRP-like cAMP-binding protein
VKDEADLNVQAQQSKARIAAVSAHPIAELLECPQETSTLLNGAAVCVRVQSGEIVFRQGDLCQGLYVVVAGDFLRKAERLNMRVNLGAVRSGELVELAAALSGGKHTYTLTAVSEGMLLMLPTEALHGAFEHHPPLRMQLLQELAREVSRAYFTCSTTRAVPARRRRNEHEGLVTPRETNL